MGYRILHIDSQKYWRGGQQQVLYLACGLKEKGHCCFLSCPPDSPLRKKGEEKGLELFPVKMRGEWDIIAIRKLSKFIKEKNIQIIHLHSARAHTLGWLATRLMSGIKKVVSRRTEFHIKKNLLSITKYRKIDRIIAISKQVRKILIEDKIPEEKIKVIYSGINYKNFEGLNGKYLYKELRLNHRRKLVGTVGSLTPDKGHKYFLNACAEVKKNFPSIQFLIIGEGKLKKSLIHLSRKLNLEDSVIFTGFRNDVPQLLSLLDVFVLPSQTEGLGTSFLEAMASGLPIVATKTGGIPEVVKEGINGILVPLNSVSSLANGILRLLKDEKLAKEYGKAGERIVKETFDIDHTINQTERVYAELIADGS